MLEEPPAKSPIPTVFKPLQVSGRPDTHAEGLGAYLLYLRHFLSKKPTHHAIARNAPLV